MLDNEHARPNDFIQSPTDSNSYSWGDINSLNIVIASLPAGEYGTASAAGAAVTTLLSFPKVRFGLLVGIGAGVPRPGRDVRLGDVVVSRPEGVSGGVVQYDFGKALQGEFRRTGFLDSPPRVLRSAVANLQARHGFQASDIPQYLNQMVLEYPPLGKVNNNGPSYTYQGIANDKLFNPTYPHKSGDNCSSCDGSQEQSRTERDSTDPVIHYGVIASGNMLIRDPEVRAEMVRRTGEDCICFEMEAAGLMNQFPCLVIRGICDYADSHKNDEWQRYAAATAAAYTKELIGFLPAEAVAETDIAAGVVIPDRTTTPGQNTTPGQTTTPPENTTTPGHTCTSEIQQLRNDVSELAGQVSTIVKMLQSSQPGNTGSGSGAAGAGGGTSGVSHSGEPEVAHTTKHRLYGFAPVEQVEAAYRRNPSKFRDDLVGTFKSLGESLDRQNSYAPISSHSVAINNFFINHSIQMRFGKHEPIVPIPPGMHYVSVPEGLINRVEFLLQTDSSLFNTSHKEFHIVFTLWRIAVDFLGME